MSPSLRLLPLLAAGCAGRDIGRTCSVDEFGADSSGKTSSTKAIQAAINSCGAVVFPAGTYLHGTLHLLNDTALSITSEAVLLGAALDSGEYSTPKTSPWSEFQDYGHSGWSDAMFFGDTVKNVTISGSGVVDGNGGLSDGTPPAGGGCRMFSFVDSEQVTIQGPLQLRNGGWFTMIFTNCQQLHLSDFSIHAVRDGIDLMQSRDVYVSGITIFGGHDDALKFGSDWSRGRSIDSYNVHVRDSTIGSNAVDAVVVGTESVGDFYNFTFSNLTLTNGSAGIGLTSYDGANIFNFSFDNIRMIGLASPFYYAVYDRLRRPKTSKPQVGSVYNIDVSNVVASDLNRNLTTVHWYSVALAMLDGLSSNDWHSDVAVGPNLRFHNVSLSFPDRGSVAPPCLEPEHREKKYPEVSAPAYAWFMRRATGVELSDVSLDLAPDAQDGRPAIVIEQSSALSLRGVHAARATGSTYDLELRHSSSVRLVDSQLVKEVDPCDTREYMI